MFLSKLILLIALELVIVLIVGLIAVLLLFLAQKKKNNALLQAETATTKTPNDESPEKKGSYHDQLEESLKQISEALPGLAPCSDPQAFAEASDQDQAKIIRFLVLDYEKHVIENIEIESELAGPFVSSIDHLFSGADAQAGSSEETATPQEGQENEDEQQEQVETTQTDLNVELEQLSKQNRMHQEVIDQFARESREMLNCISTLENENQDLRTLLEAK